MSEPTKSNKEDASEGKFNEVVSDPTTTFPEHSHAKFETSCNACCQAAIKAGLPQDTSTKLCYSCSQLGCEETICPLHLIDAEDEEFDWKTCPLCHKLAFIPPII